MPLPPALLAKLQKRGLVQQGERVEEVFAESYDDGDAADSGDVTDHAGNPTVKIIYEIIRCPNKANKYHECSQFCSESFGVTKFTHRKEDNSKRLRLLRKYPLPAGWLEVGDPTTGRCYYWNTESDKVSWLPPQHPRAKITVSVEKLHSNLRVPDSANQPTTANTRRPSEKKRSVSVNIQEPHGKRKRATQPDDLDPMDPASYSDVERGKWSTGLNADTKTGVDTTASGPLFQQRPYPSPGDILRAQAANSK